MFSTSVVQADVVEQMNKKADLTRLKKLPPVIGSFSTKMRRLNINFFCIKKGRSLLAMFLSSQTYHFDAIAHAGAPLGVE